MLLRSSVRLAALHKFLTKTIIFRGASCSSSAADVPSGSTVAVCSNGVLAAWHPRAEFPYELSRPLDIKQLRREEEEHRALAEKVREGRAGGELSDWRRAGPPNHVLKEVFYTQKHEWYTRRREERLRKSAAPNNEIHTK